MFNINKLLYNKIKKKVKTKKIFKKKTPEKFLKTYKNKGNNKYSIVIAGNKCDLENNRKVSREEGELYCKGLNIDFLECSALEKINVKECFLCVSKKLLRIKFPKAFAQEDNNKRKCFCF